MAKRKTIIIDGWQERMLTEGKVKRYNVNMNVELPKPERTAPKISTKEFEDILRKNWDKYIQSDEYSGKFSNGNFVYRFCGYTDYEGNKQLKKDLSKVKVDNENIDTIGSDIKTTKSGIPYLLCYKGGDWEVPVIFMVYWDGMNLRGYIPTYGNSFDRIRKTALGNDEDADREFIQKELKDKNIDKTLYADDITYDKNSCIKDFEARLKTK